MKSKELIPIRERLSDYEYGVTLQFRAYGGVHNPRLSYEDEINPDFSKPPISSSIRINGYKLRPSKEYPGLEEYYIKKEGWDVNYYFVEYEERESSQVIKKKIACLPGFREREKILSPMNGQCHFAQIFSPHTRVVVRFDSHILPQIKEFHQQVFTLISQFTESDQH